jgi:[acyl-carrier-protein] S-malonyltransferase
MQEAGEKNQGGMLAIIGLDREVVVEICVQSGCEISNINSPVQIVISGSIGALAKANNLAKMRGTCRSIPLKVNGAFHSALMEPVMDEFSQIISKSTFHPPGVPIIANVAAEPMNDIDSIKEELIRQLRCCIQWQRSIEYIVYKGVNTFCEVGPGKVLSGLIKRINSEAQTFNISSADSVRQLANLNIEHRT